VLKRALRADHADMWRAIKNVHEVHQAASPTLDCREAASYRLKHDAGDRRGKGMQRLWTRRSAMLQSRPFREEDRAWFSRGQLARMVFGAECKVP